MENNCPTKRQLDDILENPEEGKKHTSSVIEKTLKRAETDENYKINNKDYLKELEELHKIIKEYPQLLPPVETLVEKINKLDSEENGKYWYRFKAAIIRPITIFLYRFKIFERWGFSQQNYQEQINKVRGAILYLSSILYPLYEKHFLKEVWNDFMKPYSTLKDSIERVSNKLKVRIIFLLSNPEWHKKYFEEIISNQQTISMKSGSPYSLHPMIIEAEQTANDISDEYIRILGEIYEKLVSKILRKEILRDYVSLQQEKFEELEKKFEELRKKFSESLFISKLSKFIKSTYPNEVDVTILSTICNIIENRVEEHIIPCYVYYNGLNCKEYLDLKKYEKGLDLLSSIHYDLLDLWLRVYHNKRDLPNFEQSLADISSLMYRTGQIVDTKTLIRLARKEAALRCIKNTVYDLFENPDKHQQLIKEGNYLDEILNRYCK